MRFFKTDLKRIFTEHTFWLSILLGLVLYLGAFAYLLPDGPEGLYTHAQALAFPFAAPLLAAMPYSTMIMRERENRFGTMMTIKLRKNSYRFERFLTCGISGAAALLVPQIVLFAVCGLMGGVEDFAFALSGLVLPVTFGFGWAAIAYGLTFVNRLSYVPLVMPQVLYLLCAYAFPYLDLERFYPPLDISPSVYGGTITADRFVLPALLAVLGLILTAVGKGAEEQ